MSSQNSIFNSFSVAQMHWYAASIKPENTNQFMATSFASLVSNLSAHFGIYDLLFYNKAIPKIALI